MLAFDREKHYLQATGLYSTGLGILLLLALALRLTGFTWGFDHIFNIDEAHTLNLSQNLLYRFLNSGSLDPVDSSYGALPLYLMSLSKVVADQVLQWIKTLFPVPVNSAPMVYVGRLLSAIESAATVWLTAELARRLFGRSVALLSALFLTISLLPVREAHFATVDTLLVALIALVLLFGEKIASRGNWRDYLAAGTVIALAAATKLVAVLLVVPVLIAHLSSLRIDRARVGQDKSRYLNFNNSILLWTNLTRFLTLGVVVVALWFLLNPYALLNPETYFDLSRNNSISTQSQVVRGTLPVLYTLQFTDTLPYVYVVTNLLRWGMGLPLEIMALAGVVYSLLYLLSSLGFFTLSDDKEAENRKIISFADAYLLSWFLIYFVITGAWFAKFIRYSLPLIPVLCILSGRLMVDLFRRGGRVVRGLSAVLIVSVTCATLAYTVGYVQIYRQQDTRLTTVSWLQQNVPYGASIFVEKDEGLFFHRAARMYNGYNLEGYDWQVWNPYEIDGIRSVRYQAPEASDQQTRAYLDSILNTDYVVVSSFWKERFMKAEDRFPAQADFYSKLFDGKAGYRLIQSFRVYPKLGPFVWHDDEAEITFRLFDHPTVYIFIKDQQTDDKPI